MVKLVLLHAGQTHRGGRGIAVPIFNWVLEGGRVVSVTPQLLYSLWRRHHTHCTGGWWASWPVQMGLKNLVPTGVRSQTIQSKWVAILTKTLCVPWCTNYGFRFTHVWLVEFFWYLLLSVVLGTGCPSILIAFYVMMKVLLYLYTTWRLMGDWRYKPVQLFIPNIGTVNG